MEEHYFVKEKVTNSKNKYVPVSVEIFKEGEKGYKVGFPWQNMSYDRRLKPGDSLYLVTFIEHSGKDHVVKPFSRLEDARKYIKGLQRAIQSRENVNEVNLHFGRGKESLSDVLFDLPVNTYVNFKTPLSEYSVTLAKANYQPEQKETLPVRRVSSLRISRDKDFPDYSTSGMPLSELAKSLMAEEY